MPVLELREKRVGLFAICVVLVWSMWAYLPWRREETLDLAGKRVVQAIVDRDARTLRRYLMKSELKVFDSNPSSLDVFLRTMVPSPESRTNLDVATLPVYSDTALSVAAYVTYPEIGAGRYEIIVHPTEEGPKALIVGSVLMDSMAMRFGAEHSGRGDKYRTWRGIDDGLTAHAEDLKRIGILGFQEDDGRFVTLESLSAFARKVWTKEENTQESDSAYRSMPTK